MSPLKPMVVALRRVRLTFGEQSSLGLRLINPPNEHATQEVGKRRTSPVITPAPNYGLRLFCAGQAGQDLHPDLSGFFFVLVQIFFEIR
jgi:hypothetical protein